MSFSSPSDIPLGARSGKRQSVGREEPATTQRGAAERDGSDPAGALSPPFYAGSGVGASGAMPLIHPDLRPSFPGANLPEFSRLFAAVERQLLRLSTGSGVELLPGTGPYAVGVTSAAAGEGKSSIAVNLAIRAARDSGKKVCLIDLGMGDDDICRLLSVPSYGDGIIPLLEGRVSELFRFQADGLMELAVVPAGKPPDNAARVARSERVAEILDFARGLYDLIIVDLPAICTDNALPLVRHLDSTILVVCAGITPRDAVRHAIGHLGPENVLGMVMNRSRSVIPRWLQRWF